MKSLLYSIKDPENMLFEGLLNIQCVLSYACGCDVHSVGLVVIIPWWIILLDDYNKFQVNFQSKRVIVHNAWSALYHIFWNFLLSLPVQFNDLAIVLTHHPLVL